MRYLYLLIFIISFLYGTTTINRERDRIKDRLSSMAVIRIRNEKEQAKQAEFRSRVGRVEKFLEKYHSPLANNAEDFVRVADRYSIDYRLLPAIAGKESTFCKFYIAGSNNCWGWGRGLIRFSSFTAAIETIGKGLATTYDTGTIRAIAYRYAPSYENNTEKWISDVQHFMNQIK